MRKNAVLHIMLSNIVSLLLFAIPGYLRAIWCHQAILAAPRLRFPLSRRQGILLRILKIWSERNACSTSMRVASP